MAPTEPIPVEDIEAARARITDVSLRTPLVRLNAEDMPAEIYLKLENLQPIGSFKIRGAANAMRQADRAVLRSGVWTASAGNMAQGVAWCARAFGVPCHVIVPDHAPEAKLSAMRRLGATYDRVPWEAWFEIVMTGRYEGMEGVFIHPVSDPAVMAGNGTIGLEIFEDLPDVDAVVIPYGGGGLSSGIASALRAKKPEVKIYACEIETAAPLAASFEAKQPMKIDYTPSFVDGMGSAMVLPDMWPLVSRLIDGSVVPSLRQTADALKLMAERNHVIAEGAGAAPIAAAMTGMAGGGKIVCIVSGGNIDTAKVVKILQGEVPVST